MVSTCHLFANPATTANKKHPTPHNVILRLDPDEAVSIFDFFFAFAILKSVFFLQNIKISKFFDIHSLGYTTVFFIPIVLIALLNIVFLFQSVFYI